MLAMGLILGCSSTSDRQNDGGQSPISAAVTRAALSPQLYSFRYYQGARVLYVHLPAYDTSITCASLAASKGRGYSDVWYLDLYIDWSIARAEASLSSTFPPDGAGDHLAYLDIVHDNGSKWTVNASAGRATITLAPMSEMDQLEGVPVHGHLEFTYPSQPLALISCEATVSLVDGGTIQEQRCTCADFSGHATGCVGTAGENCCTAAAGNDRETFSLDIAATPCGLFCTTTPGDPNECSALFPGP